MSEETQAQRASVDRLIKARFSVTRVCNNDDETCFVLMARRARFGMHLAQVESDGLVNGETVADFLSSFKNR